MRWMSDRSATVWSARRPTRLLASAGLVLLLSSCGDGPFEPQAAEREFVAEITGARSFSIRVPSRNKMFGPFWTAYGRTDELAVFVHSEDVRPEVGRYEVERLQKPSGSVSIPPSGYEQGFNSISGVITITESTSSEVAGHFDLTAEQVQPTRVPETQIRVRGAFHVVCEVACE